MTKIDIQKKIGKFRESLGWVTNDRAEESKGRHQKLDALKKEHEEVKSEASSPNGEDSNARGGRAMRLRVMLLVSFCAIIALAFYFVGE